MALSIRQCRAALWALLAAGFLFVNFHRTATAVLAALLLHRRETRMAGGPTPVTGDD